MQSGQGSNMAAGDRAWFPEDRMQRGQENNLPRRVAVGVTR